jgi:DNA-binding PadR family transcriptional regulator
MGEKMTFATVRVLQAVAQGQRYGFGIMDATGLASGTVYPILSRLEEGGWVRSRWEDQHIAHDAKRPPRRYYEVTEPGRQRLEEALAQFRALAEAGDATPSSVAEETG